MCVCVHVWVHVCVWCMCLCINSVFVAQHVGVKMAAPAVDQCAPVHLGTREHYVRLHAPPAVQLVITLITATVKVSYRMQRSSPTVYLSWLPFILYPISMSVYLCVCVCVCVCDKWYEVEVVRSCKDSLAL